MKHKYAIVSKIVSLQTKVVPAQHKKSTGTTVVNVKGFAKLTKISRQHTQAAQQLLNAKK